MFNKKRIKELEKKVEKLENKLKVLEEIKTGKLVSGFLFRYNETVPINCVVEELIKYLKLQIIVKSKEPSISFSKKK